MEEEVEVEVFVHAHMKQLKNNLGPWMKKRKERKIQKREERGKKRHKEEKSCCCCCCWSECERNNIALSSSWDPLIMRL